MKSKLYLLFISFITITIFGGCDKSNITSLKNDGNNSRIVTVERGNVYGATVTDALGDNAKQIPGTNKYKFNTDIVFPVKAIGGWIDVNNDGEKDLSDILLTLPLYSYSNNITPITTYLADSDPHKREENIKNTITMLKTVSDIELTEEQLLSLPSKVSAETIFLSNVIFENMVQSNMDSENNYILSTQNILNDYIALNDTFKNVSDENLDDLMIATESYIISNIQGYVTYLTEEDLAVDINKIYSIGDFNADGHQIVIIYNNYPNSYWNTLNESYIENSGYQNVKIYEVDSSSTCNEYPNAGMCQSIDTGYYHDANNVTNFVVIANNSDLNNVINSNNNSTWN